MPSPREALKERKHAQVREAIIEVAARRIAERGFRGITIDDIAAELGYTKSAVYYYFNNKAELLWKIFEQIYESYISAAIEVRDSGAEPKEAMSIILRHHIENVIIRSDWTAIYFREENELSAERQRVIRSRKREYDKILEDIYEAGVRRGDFADIPPPLAINAIVGACNWLHTWFRSGGRYTVDQIVQHYTTLLAKGYEAD